MTMGSRKEGGFMVATQSNSGVESPNVDDLSVDSNVIDPKADRLGYAPFARHLADSICKMAFARFRQIDTTELHSSLPKAKARERATNHRAL